MKFSTLCYLIEDDKVLLAMKKRGFGKGKYNGVGGKIEIGESAEESAVREIKEEIGVEVNLENLNNLGILNFHSENPDLNWQSVIFTIQIWKNNPIETEEMLPEWFKFPMVPYSQMWVDDKLWFPLTLTGKKIRGDFTFNYDGSKIEKYFIDEV